MMLFIVMAFLLSIFIFNKNLESGSAVLLSPSDGVSQNWFVSFTYGISPFISAILIVLATAFMLLIVMDEN